MNCEYRKTDNFGGEAIGWTLSLRTVSNKEHVPFKAN